MIQILVSLSDNMVSATVVTYLSSLVYMYWWYPAIALCVGLSETPPRTFTTCVFFVYTHTRGGNPLIPRVYIIGVKTYMVQGLWPCLNSSHSVQIIFPNYRCILTSDHAKAHVRGFSLLIRCCGWYIARYSNSSGIVVVYVYTNVPIKEIIKPPWKESNYYLISLLKVYNQLHLEIFSKKWS